MTLARKAHLAVPGALTAYLGFNAGGFFPGSVGFATAVLLVLLVLRVTLAREPWSGWSRSATVAAAGAALLAAWTLVSSLWSDFPAGALTEFDRTLLYLCAFALAAMAPRERGDLAIALRWVLLAIVAIACAGLATRLFPNALGHVPPRDVARLAWPLTYWNALGVCCALGAVLALHCASGREEPAAVRVLASGALPLVVVAGLFTFSRGGIAAAAVGLGLYVVLAHPRRLLLALATGGVAGAVALAVAYGADALASPTYFRGAGPAEGRHVALVVLACCVLAALARVLLLPLERRLDALVLRPRLRRRLLAGAAIALVVVAASSALALDAPARLRAEARGFTEGNYVAETGDYRQRLSDPGNNGRLALWRVALDAYRSEPLHGIGAARYRSAWERDRPITQQVVDGHSLYLETLAELGLVGLALLALLLGGMAVGVAGGGARASSRHARAAIVAAGVALLLHAALDWDWEMPVLFGWLFGVCGIACARRAGSSRRGSGGPPRLARVVAGLALLVVAVTPFLLWQSQSSLVRGDAAFARGDCATAVDEALESARLVSVRPEPYEMVGYCDLRSGAYRLGVEAMEKARARDPYNWRYAYGLAIAQALAGRDPHAAIAAARRLNPLEPLATELARGLRGENPARWRRAAWRAQLPPG